MSNSTKSVASALNQDAKEILSAAESNADIEERDTEEEESRIVEYACPYGSCTYTDEEEEVVRLHITRSDDMYHRDVNGFSPAANVIGYDKNGDEVDILEGRPSQISRFLETGQVTTELIPDEIGSTDKQKVIIQTSLMNPTTTMTELHELADKKCKEEGIDPDGVSYGTVSNVVQKYRTKDHTRESRGRKEVEDYEDLSDAMRAAVDQFARYKAARKFDDITQREMAAELLGKNGDGLAQSNMSYVKSRYDGIIELRTAQARQGDIDIIEELLDNPCGLKEPPEDDSLRANESVGDDVGALPEMRRLQTDTDTCSPATVTTDADTIADAVTFARRAHATLIDEYELTNDPATARAAVAYKAMSEMLLANKED